MRTLGRGAMGVVYEAHDPAIDRKVAVKLVRTDLLAGRERQDYVERFRREAQAVGRCNHPGIVAIYDFALHEGDPFLAMEYVEGLGLDQALAHGEGFGPEAAVHVVLQVLDALGYAHAQGIVHRDIKPANIFLMAGGRVKVMDFGIARLDTADLSQVGVVVGTPSYMSPEQCRGEAVDSRSDLFSAAVLLQEMLIGQRPFPGRSFTEIARRLLDGPPAGGAELAAVAGVGVRSAIHRALASRPEDRFASAEAMADALRQALGGSAPQTVLAEAIDKTVVAVRARAAAAGLSGGAELDPALLTRIERRLAQQVGPIARYLMQTSLRTAASVEDLCELLARRVDAPDSRQRFLSEALELVRTGGSGRTTTGMGQSQALPSSSIPPEEIERAQRALTATLGPIARILVRRALGQARSSGELWDLLATHIGPAAERAVFLRQREGG